MEKAVTIELRLPEGQTLESASRPEIGQAMDAEIERFGRWFINNGNAPLTKIEIAAIKTFIAFKVLYEGRDRDPQTGG